MLTLSDVWMLVKKIAVGIVITVVPLFIFFAGLWVVHKTVSMHENHKPAASATEDEYAN